MKFSLVSLFPEIFEYLKTWSIIGRAVNNGLISIETINIRDFSKNKHKKVDDYSYGGGPGMVMCPEPIYDAIKSVKTDNSKVIYLSPQGKVLSQDKLIELSKEEHLILLSGHYEGIDNRIIENYVDEEISIGDYVLTGGEIPSMVLIDGITRLIPKVLSSEDSFKDESHYSKFLEFSQYTRPRDFKGHSVPDVLLSGDHEKVKEYREIESIKNTLRKRPDLISKMVLNERELSIINKILENES